MNWRYLQIEEYKAGFKKDDTRNVMSVTKSVTSLLVGIAARSNAGCESKEDQLEYLMKKNDHGKV